MAPAVSSFTGDQDKSGLLEPHWVLGTELLAAGEKSNQITNYLKLHTSMKVTHNSVVCVFVSFYTYYDPVCHLYCICSSI